MDEKFIVTWQDHQVGEITNITFDMGYWDGEWKPYEKEQTQNFLEAISQLSFEKFRTDPYKSERVLIFDANTNKNPIYGLVYLIDGDLISLRQLISQEVIDEFFFTQHTKNEHTTFAKNDADEKIRLLHTRAEQLIRNKVTEENIISALTTEGISADYAALVIENVKEDILKRKAFWQHLFAGISICVVTIFLNYLSYDNAAPGGFYLIIWGTFVFGAALIAIALILFRK